MLPGRTRRAAGHASSREPAGRARVATRAADFEFTGGANRAIIAVSLCVACRAGDALARRSSATPSADLPGRAASALLAG